MIYLFQATYYIQDIDSATVSHVEITAGKFRKRVKPRINDWNNFLIPQIVEKLKNGVSIVRPFEVRLRVVYVDGKFGDYTVPGLGGVMQVDGVPIAVYDEPVSVPIKKNKRQKITVYANPEYVSVTCIGPAKEVQRKG